MSKQDAERILIFQLTPSGNRDRTSQCGLLSGFHSFADDRQVAAAIVEQSPKSSAGPLRLSVAGWAADLLFYSIGIVNQVLLRRTRARGEKSGFIDLHMPGLGMNQSFG